MKAWNEYVAETRDNIFEDVYMTPSKFEDFLFHSGLLSCPDGKPGMIEPDKKQKPKNGKFIWNNPTTKKEIHTTYNPFTGESAKGDKKIKNYLGDVIFVDSQDEKFPMYMWIPKKRK